MGPTRRDPTHPEPDPEGIEEGPAEVSGRHPEPWEIPNTFGGDSRYDLPVPDGLLDLPDDAFEQLQRDGIEGLDEPEDPDAYFAAVSDSLEGLDRSEILPEVDTLSGHPAPDPGVESSMSLGRSHLIEGLPEPAPLVDGPRPAHRDRVTVPITEETHATSSLPIRTRDPNLQPLLSLSEAAALLLVLAAGAAVVVALLYSGWDPGAAARVPVPVVPEAAQN